MPMLFLRKFYDQEKLFQQAKTWVRGQLSTRHDDSARSRDGRLLNQTQLTISFAHVVTAKHEAIKTPQNTYSFWQLTARLHDLEAKRYYLGRQQEVDHLLFIGLNTQSHMHLYTCGQVCKKPSQTNWPIGQCWSPISLPRHQLTLSGYGANASHGMPVYTLAFTGTDCAYPRRDFQAELIWTAGFPTCSHHHHHYSACTISVRSSACYQ